MTTKPNEVAAFALSAPLYVRFFTVASEPLVVAWPTSKPDLAAAA